MGKFFKNYEVLDTFLQPKLKVILKDIGLEYGMSQKQAERNFLIYYKEYILKNMAEPTTKFIRFVGLGCIYPSARKVDKFKKSKHCKGNTKVIVDKLGELNPIINEKYRNKT